MGQQLRVRIKRKRRVAYLRRKNAARRAAAAGRASQTTGTERIRSVGVTLSLAPRFTEGTGAKIRRFSGSSVHGNR